MKTGLTLFFMISITIAFTVWRDAPTRQMFLYANDEINIESFYYYIFEHLFIILILFLWFSESSEYSRDYVKVFMILQTFDLVDYILTYNKIYFTVHTYPVSHNTFMVVSYASFLIYKEWKKLQSRFHTSYQ